MDFLKDFLLNRHSGQISFGLHRLTGVFLALYLIFHTWINSVAFLFGATAYTRLITMLNTPLAHVFEVIIVFSVLFHLFNGLRIMLVEFFFQLASRHREMMFGTIILTIAGALFTAYRIFSG